MRKLTKIFSITALAWNVGITAEAETNSPFNDVNLSFWGYSTIEESGLSLYNLTPRSNPSIGMIYMSTKMQTFMKDSLP